MSEALVTTIPGTTALANAGDFGGLGLDSDLVQLKPATMELMQNTTRGEGVEPGKFRVKSTGEKFGQIEIVLLKAQRGRVYFPPGGDLGAEPICRSNDAVKPSDRANAPQAMYCKSCEHSQWQGKGKGAKKPACQEKVNILFVEKTTKIPYRMTFGGMSLKPIKEALSNIAAKAKSMQAEGKNPSLFDFTLTLKPVKVDGSRGSYFVIGVTNVGTIDETKRGEFGQLFAEYVQRQKQEDDFTATENEVNAAIEGEQPTVQA